MPALRVIFFDIGDTLVFDDPPLRERFWRATQQAGLPLDRAQWPAAYRHAEDYALARYIEGVPPDNPALMRESAFRALTALSVPPLDDSQWRALRDAFVAVPFQRVLHPGAIPLLEELHRRGYIIGAISDWDSSLPELLAEMAIAPHLDALAVSAIVGVTKPDARLFQAALQQAHVAPEAAIHIGDFYDLDILGARAAGITGLLFDWKGRCPDADCPRVETFDALKNYLLSLPGLA